MDILSRMTTLATNTKIFEGISSRRGSPVVFHLFFVDDVLFFYKATSTACQQISELLSRFYTAYYFRAGCQSQNPTLSTTPTSMQIHELVIKHSFR